MHIYFQNIRYFMVWGMPILRTTLNIFAKCFMGYIYSRGYVYSRVYSIEKRPKTYKFQINPKYDIDRKEFGKQPSQVGFRWFRPYPKSPLPYRESNFPPPYTYVPSVLLKLNQNDVPQPNARSFSPFQLFPFLAAVSEVHQRHTLENPVKFLQKGPFCNNSKAFWDFSSFFSIPIVSVSCCGVKSTLASHTAVHWTIPPNSFKKGLEPL